MKLFNGLGLKFNMDDKYNGRILKYHQRILNTILITIESLYRQVKNKLRSYFDYIKKALLARRWISRNFLKIRL